MALEISPVYDLVHRALDYRSLRQDMIASNIANVDTPFYKPRDINFGHFLAREHQKILNEHRDLELKLAQTDAAHMPLHKEYKDAPNIFFRDGHLAKNDGNSVDLDVETSELGKNSAMYQALTTALKKHKGIFAYAVDAGRNL